ncbi:hypothetical protein [Enterococcus cecorum]|nr:hypothetical protein [Enterococcus cecorum]
MVRGYVPLYKQNYLTYLVNSRAMLRRVAYSLGNAQTMMKWYQ